MSANVFHVIKDPVHGTMQFTSAEDAWLKPFIDSPNFQRLRHIKQLGMGDLIFPGAVHTRFNHCLGCCYVGSQITKKIGLPNEQRQLVMIACLLHDIGHGPFSHAFEGIFHGTGIRHESWTPYFLDDYETGEFFWQYNQANPKYHITDEKFNIIANMIMHKPVENQLLADIVSSQLDADRLDYLLRDNHFCGVEYGEFDFRWMLNCMAIISTEEGDRLGITQKGIGVVEHYVMARRLMMRNIYHMQKKLAIEHTLIQLLASVAESIEHHAPFKAIGQTRLGEFLTAANHYNLQIESAKKSDSLKRQFLEKNYQTYKQLCDYDVFALINQLSDMDDDHPAVQIASRIQNRMLPKIVRFDHTQRKEVEQALREFKAKHRKAYQDWQLCVLETPHQSYSGEDDPILVKDEQGVVKPLNEYSLMIDAISDRLEHIAFLSIDKAIAKDKTVINFVKNLQVSETIY